MPMIKSEARREEKNNNLTKKTIPCLTEYIQESQ